VSDDENSQTATTAAFDALYYVAGKRLTAGLLTVIDATNTQKHARASALRLAKEQNCHACAIVFDMPEKLLIERNRHRSDRRLGEHVIRNHVGQLRSSIRNLEREGFRFVYVLRSPQEVENAEITRTKLWSDRREEVGPLDIIGDVHGCFAELCELLTELGYQLDGQSHTAVHPAGR
jgi:protein phosphatase